MIEEVFAIFSDLLNLWNTAVNNLCEIRRLREFQKNNSPKYSKNPIS